MYGCCTSWDTYPKDGFSSYDTEILLHWAWRIYKCLYTYICLKCSGMQFRFTISFYLPLPSKMAATKDQLFISYPLHQNTSKDRSSFTLLCTYTPKVKYGVHDHGTAFYLDAKEQLAASYCSYISPSCVWNRSCSIAYRDLLSVCVSPCVLCVAIDGSCTGVCVCMCVCRCVYADVCECMCACVHMQRCVLAAVRVCVLAQVCVCRCVCTQVCVCV